MKDEVRRRVDEWGMRGVRAIRLRSEGGCGGRGRGLAYKELTNRTLKTFDP
jgi:hypothetical protein